MKTATEIVVRYAETDQMGVVHHAVYPVWYEVGRTAWIEASGVHYAALEQKGILLPLSGLQCGYQKPIHYGETVTVVTALTKLTPFQVVFSYEVLREEEVVSTGSTQHGWTDKGLKPIPLKRVDPDLYALLSTRLFKGGV